MKRFRQLVEINLEELRQVLGKARLQPISDGDYVKMKIALDVLAERLMATRTTEKTRTVVTHPQLANSVGRPSNPDESRASKGHGRNSASGYTGARRVVIRHAKLVCGDACPECARGKTLHSARGNVHAELKEGGKTSAGARNRLRGLLATSEVALALVLLVGAGPMIIGGARSGLQLDYGEADPVRARGSIMVLAATASNLSGKPETMNLPVEGPQLSCL